MLNNTLSYEEYTELIESLEMSVFDVLVKYGCPNGHFEAALEDFYLCGFDVKQYDQDVVFWHVGTHTDPNVLRFLSRMVDVTSLRVFESTRKHAAKLNWARLTENVVNICREESAADSVLEFCRVFADHIVWTDLCQNMGLFAEYSPLWAAHEDRIVWGEFSEGDAETVLKYQDRVDWARLCSQSYSLFNEMDDCQFTEIEHRAHWAELSKNNHLCVEFVEKHFTKLDHATMFEHLVRFPRTRYFARNAHLVKLDVIRYLGARGLYLIEKEIRKLDDMFKAVDACADFVCPICRTSDLSGVVQVKCGHCFHAECIAAWHDRVPSCPMCRAAI